MLLATSLTYLLLLYQAGSSKTADYYRNLWLESVQAAREWKPQPCYNEIFRTNITSCEDYGEYDFVIVGGGPGGLVLANRLSEVKCWTVLVLEMGGNESNFSLIPGASTLVKNSDLNRAYRTVPQEYACKDSINAQCVIHSGQVLGGASGIDEALYARGSREDFDGWIPYGENEWSYDHLVEYYQKLEHKLFPEDNHHPQTTLDVNTYILKANEEMGYQHMNETRALVRNGLRISINQAYLKPALHRKNLKIVTGTYAFKITFVNKKATAQQFILQGRCYSARIKRELILTGGAIMTPQLLQISGIGSKPLLNSLAIPVVADLPVGTNLFDNPTIDFKYRTDFCKLAEDLNTDLEDLANGVGGLTAPESNLITQGWFPRAIQTHPNLPDVRIAWSTPRPYDDFNTLKKLNSYDDSKNALLLSIRANDIIAKAALLRPKSRGEITATTSDPFSCPSVNPRYLDNLADLLDVHTLIAEMYRFEHTGAFAEIAARLNFHVGSCEPFLSNKRMYVQCITCHVVGGLSNFGGTCALGCDLNSVLDQRLLLRGVKNVRVVDSSAIPAPMSVVMTYTVAMMAERLADIIKESHELE